jgi:hypothetical protein
VVGSSGSCSAASTATSWSISSDGAVVAEPCHALEVPAWDRFGSFAGQPRIVGMVVWTTADRRVVIAGRRSDERFDELV